MSNDTPALTAEILDRFHQALRHAGAPLGNEIGPGLSDEQIDRLTEPLGLQAPPELRTLWRWGTAPIEPATNASWEINPEFDLWPPAQAIKETKEHRLDKTVSRATIAFGGPTGDAYLLVDGNSDAATSRVTYADIEDPETISAAPSLGALFVLWTDQLAGGDYRYVEDRWEPLDGPQTIIVDQD